MPSGRPRGSTNAARNARVSGVPLKINKRKNPSPPPKELTEQRIYYCTSCGKEYKKLRGNFRASQSPFFKGWGYIPVCQNCLDFFEQEYTEMLGSNDEAIKRLALHLDLYLNESLLNASGKIKVGQSRIASYIANANLLQYQGCTYDNYIDECISGFILPSSVYGESTDSDTTLKDDIWTEDDLKNKQNVIEVVGYDPFEGYPEIDKKFLFNELVKYFDDDISDDTYKLSQIIQIVNNNNQIRRYDLRIASMNPVNEAESIKLLNGIKKDLVLNNDKIAKENEISVKNRSNKDIGKSTLSHLMRDLRQKDFEKAEADYYDQLKSQGTFWAVEMSDKAIQQNGMFDENDKQEIFNIQRELIKKLEEELDDEKEKNRLLHKEVDKLKSQ